MRRAMVALAAALVLAACGGDDADELVVEQPRIGATPIGADAALYFGVTSPLDDRLVGVDTDVAGVTSLHVTGSADGTMIEVDEFELPADTQVLFEPFGDHVMLEQVVRELEPGDEVEVTLRFAEHAPVQVSADVSQLYELAWEDS
ncbi:copper chaperone PCu(A)C [Ilumatobacter fluminis]|nr:copper chaperone PCu(A)C [Ilumatobacter fluminis]